MIDTKTKKLSRRDAIKLLGAAAGATALANLPSKWSKPSLTSGVLPAHAATSLLTIFSPCNNNTYHNVFLLQTAQVNFTATTTPNTNVNFQLSLMNLSLVTPGSTTGTVMSNSAGALSLTTQVLLDANDTPNSITNQFENICIASTVNFNIFTT